MTDVLITGGTIVEGTGKQPFKGDVLISDGVISAVGELEHANARRIDASGCVVAPGFIDIHSHSDFGLLTFNGGETSLRQGVTTEVVGNCGLSFAPAYRGEVISDSLPALQNEFGYTWSSFDDYLSTLERIGVGINIAHLVGLNALRLSAAGYADRPLTDNELELVLRWTNESLDAGAWGFSAGLEYVPGRSATTSELQAICRTVAGRDGIFGIHVRNQGKRYIDSIEEALTISAGSGVRLQISHIPPHYLVAPTNSVERVLGMIEETRRTGVEIAFDAHPYLWGMSFPTAVLPAWAFEGGTDALVRRLKDPHERARMQSFEDPLPSQIKLGLWDTVVPRNLSVSSQFNGMSIQEIAKVKGTSPMDAVYDLLLEEADRIRDLVWIFEIVSADDLRLLMAQDCCAIESDGFGGAEPGHPRCRGWTARLLGEHVRENSVLSLEEAVRRITSLPASLVGLPRRGILEPDYHADVVIFDPQTIRDRATYQDPDQPPEGIRWVFVNGEPAVQDGEILSNRLGRVLRKK